MKPDIKKKTPKQRVLSRFADARCEWSRAQLGYRVVSGGAAIGLGPSAPAAWRDASSKIPDDQETDLETVERPAQGARSELLGEQEAAKRFGALSDEQRSELIYGFRNPHL